MRTQSDKNNFLLASEDGSVEFNEVGINFSTSITDDIRIGLQLYCFDLGDLGNNQIKLDWAFLDYSWKEALGIRVGKVKTSFGLYNNIRDYDMLRISILLPQSHYHRYWRDIAISTQGMELYGNVRLTKRNKLGYSLAVGTAGIDPEGGMAKMLSINGTKFKSGVIDYSVIGQLIWHTPLKGLKLGGSIEHYKAKYLNVAFMEMPVGPVTIEVPSTLETDMNNSIMYILSVEYDRGAFTISGAYYRQQSDMVMTFKDMPFIPPIETKLENESYDVLLSYRLNNWLAVGTYYLVF